MKKSLSSILVFEALNRILCAFPNLRIHFHYLGYFLILSTPIKQEKALIRKNGLILSSLIAAIKATGREIVSLKEIADVSLDFSSEGFESLENLQEHLIKFSCITQDKLHVDGIFHSSSFSLIGVPTIVVQNPVTTVGLGDHISSISIFYEIG